MSSIFCIETRAMSFREKSAWITLVTVLVCFGAYFVELFRGMAGDHHFGGLPSLHLLLLSALGLAGLHLGLTLVAAVTTPKEARGLADERERLIQWRAQSLGYNVLMVLAVSLFVPAFFGHRGVEMANFALLAVVIAALTVSVAQIIMFRRGA
jgi:drug/metabolite transporter (DMT)-like permease